MTQCKQCSEGTHGPKHPHYKLVNKLTTKGFPRDNLKYPEAHERASKAEKKAFPRKDYDDLKKLDEDIPNNQLIGKNSKDGKIEVSKKVPKKLRSEVAFHEKTENNILRKRK